MNNDNQHDLELDVIERDSVVATQDIEEIMQEYRDIRNDMTAREIQGEMDSRILARDMAAYADRLRDYREKICVHMDSAEVLVSTGGEILATCKKEKDGEFVAIK